ARQTIITLNKTKVVCEVEPIQLNGKNFGAVFRLRNTSSIQEMEAMIRQELYARGHVARFRFSDIIGESAEIRESIAMAEDYAGTNSSVLILGETGTGKEVFAQSIHNASSRSKGPFVAINCAAIPTQLLESELFGYVGGAFTGASKEGKPGLLEVAHGGTIFLDEMAEMDYANQGRLLRFHQERSVVRLGSHKVIPVDVRVIVATNKNLEDLVENHVFRDDLYYRLNVLRLELPPLRCRKGDVPLFAGHFLRQFAEESGKDLRMAPDAEKLLAQYDWPGNVRECRNIMERVVARLKSGTVTGAILHPILFPSRRFAKPVPTRVNRQKEEIARALEKASGNYGEAAELLGVNRSTLYRRMKKYGITY
ncbi:MAG: sigma 54-interacting transcriptional regulator, partial [Deltaproteobacteria bacterium]|nr:sigma 54-interacting transcriptional regulator [Deltaproteobacteria bacterium]